MLIAIRIITVSYTHLDVYKRQIRQIYILNLAELCEKEGIDFEDLFDSIVIGPTSKQTIRAVSYTHLDVYKRQIQQQAAEASSSGQQMKHQWMKMVILL